jgi:nucleotide-binding universal stress UspA family protein
MACDLAADRGARLTAIAVIEVPTEVPLERPDPDVEEAAREVVRTAQSLAAAHDIDAVGTVLHARHAGEAIVDELRARQSEVVIMADIHGPSGRLSPTTRYVLKHAPCRVMLVRGTAAPTNGSNGSEPFETVFRPHRPSNGHWPTGEFIEPV